MKKLILVCIALVASTTFYSCDKDTTTTTPNNNNNNNNNAQQGKGYVTLVCNGQTFTIAGNCNYSSPGMAIVIADSNNNANVVTFNLDGGLPTATKTYTLVDVASSGDNLSMSFTRFPSSGTMNDWETKDGAGTLTMTVEGNKITCTFSNIPMDGSDIYNPEALIGEGLCSGSFTLYK